MQLETFETEIDSAEWPAPRKARVEYQVDRRADELGDISAFDAESGEPIELSSAQEKDIIEEIWEDVRQGEGGL